MHYLRITVFLSLSCLLSACIPHGTDRPDERQEIRTLIDKSRQLVSRQEFDKAMDIAVQALTRAEESGEDSLKADALCTVSLIDLMASRDAQAWENAREAESISRDNGYPRSLCEALILMARVCSYAEISETSNRNDEALGYLNESWQVSSDHGLYREHVQTCYYLSEIYVNKNRWNTRLVPEYYKLAGRYLDEGERLAAAESLKDLSKQSVSFRIRYFRQGGKTEEAVAYCQQFLSMIDSSDWLTRQQIYDQLTVLYSDLGQADKSIESHRNYVYATQQYMRQKSDMSLQDLENRYALMLEKRQVERKQRTILTLLSLLIASFLFILQSHRFNRLIRRQNKALQEADTSKKKLLEAISSDLVDVTSMTGMNEMMELARKSYSMEDGDIRTAVKETVGKSSTLSDDVAEYFYRLISHRKTMVEKSGLTERELEILRLSGQGLSAAKIADLLHISPRTVTNHKQNIYTKMNVKSNAEMIVKAKKAGLL